MAPAILSIVASDLPHQFSFDHHHEYVKYYTPSHTADFTSNLYI